MNHIVLYQPEIPQNTGNIMRTCVAFGMRLHLIEPFGFPLSDKTIRRSNVNYTEALDYKTYATLEDFFSENSGRFYFASRYGATPPDKRDLRDEKGDVYLMFGSESSGFPKTTLQAHKDSLIRIPMHESMRSLNLASSVALLAYETVRQQKYAGLTMHEPHSQKGPNHLDD